MSVAHINAFRPAKHSNPATHSNPAANAPTATNKPTAARTIHAVPNETEARGFALYLGVDEATAAAAGTTLAEIAAALRKTFAELVPNAADQTYAAVALAPKGVGGKNVDVVRTALRDPRALDKLVEANEDEPAKGIVIDTNRHKVFADGENADLTYKEFELLQYLVQNEGETITRAELVDIIWNEADEDAPNERTIDVHIRRLRAKITGYEDIIRTVRGGGYRFDKHPDVLIEA